MQSPLRECPIGHAHTRRVAVHSCATPANTIRSPLALAGIHTIPRLLVIVLHFITLPTLLSCWIAHRLVRCRNFTINPAGTAQAGSRATQRRPPMYGRGRPRETQTVCCRQTQTCA